MDCSPPGLPVHHQLLELAQTHVHESVMPSNHLILCRPLLLLPLVFPSIRVFSSELAVRIRWPKYLARFIYNYTYMWASLVAQLVENPPSVWETWVGRCPGEGKGHALHYSCLENPMDRGAWRATVHGGSPRVKRDWATQHTHTYLYLQLLCIIIIENESFPPLGERWKTLRLEDIRHPSVLSPWRFVFLIKFSKVFRVQVSVWCAVNLWIFLFCWDSYPVVLITFIAQFFPS